MNSNLRSLLTVVIFTVVLLSVGGVAAMADSAWYSVTFTGVDIWTYSADAAGAGPAGQLAPRRYSTFNNDTTGAPDGTGPRVVQATTYGVNGGTASTVANLGFGAWADPTTNTFAFDEINLWGKDDAAAVAWGEKYIADPDVADLGVKSWKVLAAPPGWTYGIVASDPSYNPDPGAFPVWRSGTGQTLSLADMADPSFTFSFLVLISNPDTAFEANGKLRVFFGGYNDDNQNTGPDNYEVAGVMLLNATPVPEPGFIVLLGIGLGAVILIACRFKA